MEDTTFRNEKKNTIVIVCCLKERSEKKGIICQLYVWRRNVFGLMR